MDQGKRLEAVMVKHHHSTRYLQQVVVVADRVRVEQRPRVLEDQEAAALVMRGQVVLALRGREMPEVVEEPTVRPAVVAKAPSDQTDPPKMVALEVLEYQIV